MTGPVLSPNRRERLAIILEQDGPTCTWCGRILGGLARATTDHLIPRVKGGPSWIENEVAACVRCNRRRGHCSPAEWADQCELLGWEPNRELVRRRLEALQDRIRVEGGQRRARPYLAAQLRRLR